MMVLAAVLASGASSTWNVPALHSLCDRELSHRTPFPWRGVRVLLLPPVASSECR